MPSMLRIYTGDDGLSHIEEVTPTLAPYTDIEGSHGEGTPLQAATGITFRLTQPGYFLDWHNAPRRQYVINLRGEAEVEAGDGTVKRLGPGDVLLAEDLTGRGHTTRVVGDQPRFFIVVPLAE